MKTLFFSLSFLFSTWASLSARDFVPKYRLENVTATDGSMQQCLVFTSIPGVMHTVEVSEDLVNWQPLEVFGEGGRVYGLGGEVVVPMREITPSPAPPPAEGGGEGAEPPPPMVNVSVVFGRVIGGGTIATWLSLEGGAPVSVLLSGDLHEDWQMMPLYWESFGNFSLHIWQPPMNPVEPPAELPGLGTLDEELKTILQENLEGMNTKVATSAALARNTPPPAAPPSGGRLFLRARSQYEIDSDGDGTPDWAEFQMMLDDEHPSQEFANPFNADADGNGIPDGEQMDMDNDGIPDAEDADSDDTLIDWAKGPFPRYAVFEIHGAPDPSHYSGDGRAQHVTDGGHALFRKGVWTGAGGYQELQLNAGNVLNARAYGMSADGMVIGTANADLTNSGSPNEFVLVHWPSPDAAPLVVQEAGQSNFASPLSSMVYGWLDAGTLVGEGGTVIAPEYQVVPDGPDRLTTQFVGNTLWEISGGSITKTTAPQHATNHIDGNLMWGMSPDLDWNTVCYRNGSEEPLNGWYPTIAKIPNDGFVAVGGQGAPTFANAGANYAWTKSGKLPLVVDVSEQGWMAMDYGRIWANGFMVPLEHAAPGIPEEWRNPGGGILDSSPKGNLLLRRSDQNNGQYLGYALAMPFVLEDDQFATGVDAVSVTSKQPGTEPQHKQWIMVPAGGSNDLTIKSTASATSPVTLDGGGTVTLSKQTLTANEETITVSAPFGTATTDIDLGLKMGENSSVSSPIGLKVMKRRTVKVKVWLVPYLGEEGVVIDPIVKPTKEELDSYLNMVFLPQINASFDCTVTETAPLAFDVEDGTSFGAPQGSIKPFNKYLDANTKGAAEVAMIKSNYYDQSSSINIYILGGVLWLYNYSWDAQRNALLMSSPLKFMVGHTYIDDRMTVQVSSFGGGGDKIQLLNTIAHEVGHVIFKEGHPNRSEFDKKGILVPYELSKDGGRAPLPGTNHLLRLMCSGDVRPSSEDNVLIVKGEWDEAERWFIEEEKFQRIE